MERIVDTSLAVKWLVEEDDSDKAQALIGGDLLAPDLILAEIGNVIWKKWRKGEIQRDHAQLALASISSFVRLVPTQALAHEALEIALQINHPVYDCYFLALAEAKTCQLATFDRRLANVCIGTAYEPLIDYLGATP